MSDFFDGDSLPEVIRIAGERGCHLMKRIKVRRWMKGKGEDAVPVEEIDFEIARDNPAAVQLSPFHPGCDERRRSIQWWRSDRKIL